MPHIKPPRGFETSEYEQRLAKAQAHMVQQQMSCMLLTTEADILYFTGFLTQFWQSPTRPWFVIVPQQGKPIAVIPSIGVVCMKNTWIEDIRSWSSPAQNDDGISLLSQTLIEVLATHTHDTSYAHIGMPMGRESHLHMPFNSFTQVHQRLLKAYPNMTFKDCTPITRALRMVKSPNEIAKVEYIASTLSDVFDNIQNFVHPGLTDAQIFTLFKIEALKAGADDIPYLVGAIGASGYNDIISPPMNRVLKEGDILILDTGSVYDGYYCDFDRNYGFGHIKDDAKKAYEITWQATEAGFAAAKPGNRCCDLFNAMNNVMQKGGALGESVGRFGHGLGIQLTENPSHTAWDDTLLEAGMVLTLEPGMMFAKGRMMVHEENLVITETGARYLSKRAAPKLPIF